MSRTLEALKKELALVREKADAMNKRAAKLEKMVAQYQHLPASQFLPGIASEGQSFPDAVMELVKAQKGKHFTPKELAQAIAIARKEPPDSRDIYIKTYTACIRLLRAGQLQPGESRHGNKTFAFKLKR